MWYFCTLFAFPLVLFLMERTISWANGARIEKRRLKADYPITGNDPVGRAFMGW